MQNVVCKHGMLDGDLVCADCKEERMQPTAEVRAAAQRIHEQCVALAVGVDEDFTRGKWSEITNALTADEVIADYSIFVQIGERPMRLTGQDAIDYLCLLAEQGTTINGCN